MSTPTPEPRAVGWLLAFSGLIALHTVDGRMVLINPAQITQVREPLPEGHGGRQFTNGVHCVVTLTDRTYAAVRENCGEVQQAAYEGGGLAVEKPGKGTRGPGFDGGGGRNAADRGGGGSGATGGAGAAGGGEPAGGGGGADNSGGGAAGGPGTGGSGSPGRGQDGGGGKGNNGHHGEGNSGNGKGNGGPNGRK